MTSSYSCGPSSPLDLGRFESFDPCQGLGGEIHESFGEFFAVLVEAAHRISCIERGR